jgi:glutamyl-tRNA synthetase
MTISALREFIIKQGPSRNVTNMDWASFWASNKKEIDPVAPRYTAISKKGAVKVNLTGSEAPTSPVFEERPMHPKNKAVRDKKVAFASEILLEQADVKLLKPGYVPKIGRQLGSAC